MSGTVEALLERNRLHIAIARAMICSVMAATGCDAPEAERRLIGATAQEEEYRASKASKKTKEGEP